MWHAYLRRLAARLVKSPRRKQPRSPIAFRKPRLEFLEDRTLLTTLPTVAAGDVAGLISAINQANTDSSVSGVNDTIVLTNSPYTLTTTNNALPIITAKNLLIQGNGATLNGASLNRLFDVNSGAGLVLQNLTLKGGLASDSAAQGGAIRNNGGNVTLSNVQVQGNTALGGAGQNAEGGGIYSVGGSLSLSNVTLKNNQAIGGAGTPAAPAGGSAEGGGLYIVGGTTTLSGTEIITGNEAIGGSGVQGWRGGNGGNAQGGGIYASGVSLSFSGGEILSNDALAGAGGAGLAGTARHMTGGQGGQGGTAQGGGLYASGSSVTLQNGTLIGSIADNAPNIAGGGQGGVGGAGGEGNSTTPVGGNGGNGGAGGLAAGGGLFATGNGAALIISGATLERNQAAGGAGGGANRGGNGLNISDLNGGVFGAGGNSGNAGNGGAGQGGGIAVDGTGDTTLPTVNLSSNTLLEGNAAAGGNGGTAATAGSGGAGGHAGGNGGGGGSGALGQGGGLYVNDGTLTVPLATASNVPSLVVTGNAAGGGSGGSGGSGGRGGFNPQSNNTLAFQGGAGGAGGAGGSAAAGQGGGLYLGNSTVTLNTTSIASNQLLGGQGGSGGFGGAGGNGRAHSSALTYTHAAGAAGGAGGSGAAGGAAQGGGLAAVGGTLTLNAVSVTGNTVNPFGNGGGGVGRDGGTGGSEADNGGNGGNAGNGGDSGAGQGGGLYLSGGTFTVLNTTIAQNAINGGPGGNGGRGANGGEGSFGLAPDTPQNAGAHPRPFGGNGGNGGSGGNVTAVQGGGVFADTGSTVKLINTTVANNTLTPGARGGNGGNGGDGGAAKSVGGNAGNGGNAGSANGGLGAGLYSNGGSLSLLNATVAYNTITANSPTGNLIGAQGTPGNPGTPQLGAKNNSGQYSGTGQPGHVGGSGSAANSQGGGLYVGSGSTTLENTIIALDSAPSNNDVFGTIASGDHDLIGDGTGATFTTTNGDSIGQYTSAQLTGYFSQLANGIGPTATVNPTSTSPVFGAGDASAAATIATAEGLSSASDQRGLPRLYNGKIDIGAVQSGLFIMGDANASTVTPGNNITYTFTVINGGPDAVTNVTLSDAIPANTTFVSFSAPSGWTTSTLAAGGNVTVSATLGSLAPDDPTSSVATFTLVVQVNSATAGGTTITNTASITGTAPNSNLASSGATVNVTVPGGDSNITSSTSIQQTPLFRLGPLFVQLDVVTNTSSTTFQGPVDLVLTNLPSGVTLLNASGTVASGQYAGDPYIQLVGATGSFAPGQTIYVPLLFYAPGRKTFTYTAVVIEGS